MHACSRYRLRPLLIIQVALLGQALKGHTSRISRNPLEGAASVFRRFRALVIANPRYEAPWYAPVVATATSLNFAVGLFGDE